MGYSESSRRLPTFQAAEAAARVKELEKKYLLGTYSRYDVLADRGSGAYLIDKSNKRYLDLLAGIAVNALGYNHPRIKQVLRKQIKRLFRKVRRHVGDDDRDDRPAFDSEWWHQHQQRVADIGSGHVETRAGLAPARPELSFPGSAPLC